MITDKNKGGAKRKEKQGKQREVEDQITLTPVTK